jgi:hypothetical protein
MSTDRNDDEARSAEGKPTEDHDLEEGLLTGASGSVGEEPASPSRQASRPERSGREATLSRRILVQAGWVTPVILAIATPQSAHAEASATRHSDIHVDSHIDK